jgi:aldose sugar dehydrogenase
MRQITLTLACSVLAASVAFALSAPAVATTHAAAPLTSPPLAATGTDAGAAPVPAVLAQAPRAEDRGRVQRSPRPAGTAQPAEKPRIKSGPNPGQQLPNPPFTSTAVATFDQPWAMSFLPDGRLLITEKPGKIKLFNPATSTVNEVSGVPTVQFGGQGGLGDVVLHPQYASNRYVYLSYAEAGANSTRGAVVARAQLTLDAGGGGSLGPMQVVWRQTPKVTGEGHYSHRIAFGRDGKLWITSGDRQKMTPAQDLNSNLGKLLRLNDDGSTPSDNPFAAQGGAAAQVWSYGHRNLLGIAFDTQGRLWTHEMGPANGDELNLIERGSNYGWPLVSNGQHYDGTNIPDHTADDGYNAPEAWWNPTIAPAGFMIYSGNAFPYFGLASQALIRVQFDGSGAREAARYPMGRRIREVEQGPDGSIWLLEDGSAGRLLKLTPKPL